MEDIQFWGQEPIITGDSYVVASNKKIKANNYIMMVLMLPTTVNGKQIVEPLLVLFDILGEALVSASAASVNSLSSPISTQIAFY